MIDGAVGGGLVVLLAVEALEFAAEAGEPALIPLEVGRLLHGRFQPFVEAIQIHRVELLLPLLTLIENLLVILGGGQLLVGRAEAVDLAVERAGGGCCRHPETRDGGYGSNCGKRHSALLSVLMQTTNEIRSTGESFVTQWVLRLLNQTHSPGWAE